MALTVGFTEKIFSGNPTVFGSWSFLSLLLNPTLIYRRSFSSLWRRLEELETLKPESSDKSLVYGVAKKLADVSGLVSGVVYRRIMPRCVDEPNGRHVVYSDGASWYPEACRSAHSIDYIHHMGRASWRGLYSTSRIGW